MPYLEKGQIKCFRSIHVYVNAMGDLKAIMTFLYIINGHVSYK